MTVRSRVAWTLTTSLLVPLAWSGLILAQDPPRKDPPPPAEPSRASLRSCRRSRSRPCGAACRRRRPGSWPSRRPCSPSATTCPTGRPATPRCSRGKAVQGGVRAKLPAGVTWESLDGMTPEQVRERDAFPLGLPAPAPSQPSRRRHAVPAVPHRRHQARRAARPAALRPRLRPARPLPARVPAAHLPHHAHRTSATSRRASSSPSTTSSSSSTASSTPSSSTACACC